MVVYFPIAPVGHQGVKPGAGQAGALLINDYWNPFSADWRDNSIKKLLFYGIPLNLHLHFYLIFDIWSKPSIKWKAWESFQA